MLDKDGTPSSSALWCPPGGPTGFRPPRSCRRALQELGITVNLETPDGSIHDQDRKSGNYDTFLHVHGGDCNMHANFFNNFHRQ